MSKASDLKVSFYEYECGTIGVVKGSMSFSIPAGCGYGDTAESRATIAEHFDSSPLNNEMLSLHNATFIEEI